MSLHLFNKRILDWCPKKGPRIFGRNFDKIRQLFVIFGMNYPDIVKCPINTCTTLRNDDVIVTSLNNAVFARREFILPFKFAGFKSS